MAATARRSLPDVEEDIDAVLHDRLNESSADTVRVKAHHLEDEVDASRLRIGQALARLAEANTELGMERWTAPSTNPQLWVVSR